MRFYDAQDHFTKRLVTAQIPLKDGRVERSTPPVRSLVLTPGELFPDRLRRTAGALSTINGSYFLGVAGVLERSRDHHTPNTMREHPACPSEIPARLLLLAFGRFRNNDNPRIQRMKLYNSPHHAALAQGVIARKTPAQVAKYTAPSCGLYSLFGPMRNHRFMPPRSRSDESEVEALREVLKCIESALKALERSNKKREPRLKTVVVNLQVSRNMVRHFLSALGAPYPPP